LGIKQEHKEHCSAYFAAYNSVTNSATKRLEHRLLYLRIGLEYYVFTH